MELQCTGGLTGIYCIENVMTGKKYVGQAKDIKYRWETHIKALRNCKHYNAYLQNAWNKYGEDAFMFSVLEICDVSALSEREIRYIEVLGTFKDGYNLTMGGEGTRGRLHTDETKAHMSELNKGKVFSPETRLKMSLAKKGKPSNRRITKDVIEGYKRASEKKKGMKFSEEHKKHLSEAKRGCTPWNKGKKFSPGSGSMNGRKQTEEAKRKISEATKGRPASQAVIDAASKKIRCVETGRVYPSITAAAKEYGITINAISCVLRGKNKTCKGLHWEYVN